MYLRWWVLLPDRHLLEVVPSTAMHEAHLLPPPWLGKASLYEQGILTPESPVPGCNHVLADQSLALLFMGNQSI